MTMNGLVGFGNNTCLWLSSYV